MNRHKEGITGRNYGIDALRIVAMFFIVMIHVLYKSELLSSATGLRSAGLWLLEVIGLCAVNCYAMISGYVMYSVQEKEYRYARYFDLWFSGFVYSLGITLVFHFWGDVTLTKDAWMTAILPVTHESYWYLTAYTPLFFLVPWLNKWIRTLKEKELTILVITLFGLFCIVNLLYDPFELQYGYSFLWLAILYLFGAWIKKCDIETKMSTKLAIVLSALCILLSWAWLVFSHTERADFLIKYNSPTTVIYAICLLVIFSKYRPKNWARSIIAWVSPAIFGVYLIHEHPLVRVRFKQWFAYLIPLRLLYVIPVLLGTVLAIFMFCIFVEKVRRFLTLERFCDIIEGRSSTKEKENRGMERVDYINYDRVDEKTKESMDRLFKASKRSFWMRKRCFDIVVSLMALIVLLPFFVLFSLIIFLDDPHASPIFCQKRIGRHGKEFTIYKFRTMVANAEQLKASLADSNEMDGPVFKMTNDPRITRVGRILRRTSIDELPQLFNVLKGDMSFVGPRPPLPQEVEQYNDYQRLRLVVTPGLTCIWQTENDRNDIMFDDWVEMDIDYIEHRTMFKDLLLMIRTVLVMFTKEGR